MDVGSCFDLLTVTSRRLRKRRDSHSLQDQHFEERLRIAEGLVQALREAGHGHDFLMTVTRRR